MGMEGEKMKVLHFHAGDNRSWGGKSRELSPGLLATYGSRDITQEGMGIGSVALKTGGFTYFPSTCITEYRTPYNIIKTFSLDSRLTLHCGTFLSPFLSWVSEQIVAFYMRHPVLQKTILAGSHNLQRLLPLRFCRESFPSLAEARFAYIINGLFVTVTCNISLNGTRTGKAYILNELGADYFTSSLHHETVARPPSGWEQLPLLAPTPALYDEMNDLTFRIVQCATEAIVPPKIFWGRERSSSLCWAGFAIEIDMTGCPAGKTSLQYTVEFAERKNS